MTRSARTRITLLAVTSLAAWFVVSAAAADKPAFLKTWKAPGSEQVRYAGRKLVGLVVSDDIALRMSTEEALARQLTTKGVEGIAAYKVIPREEIRDPNVVKGWFERTGAAGVVIMRLVDLSKETMPSVVVWQGAYYDSLYSYYPYAWGATFNIGGARTDVKVVVETLVFDIASNKLMWAGTSQSVNPENGQALVASIVDLAANQIRKDGLTRKK